MKLIAIAMILELSRKHFNYESMCKVDYSARKYSGKYSKNASHIGQVFTNMCVIRFININWYYCPFVFCMIRSS